MNSINIKYIIGLVLFGGLVMAAVAGADDLVNQKKELEKIKEELEQCQQSLDSLRRIEGGVLKEISNYEQQASANQTTLKRLNNQLYSVRNGLDKAGRVRDESQARYQAAIERYVSNLQYYYRGLQGNRIDLAEEIDAEKDIFRKVTYLKALASYDRQDLSRSSEYLDRAETEYTDLVTREKQVGDAHKKKRSEYVILSSRKEKRERDLSKLRRKKEREADRLVTLSETARQMEELVARLEQARKEREQADTVTDFEFSTGNFATYKGGLPPPVAGKVISSFGWKRDKTTNLKSFSPGLEISCGKKAAVRAVAPGVVAYAGNMRGYDEFVIVEHEDGYYSMYAGLNNLTVEKSRIVDRGSRLGDCPTGRMKFELRQGREAVDPIEWIRIDAFK